LPLRQEDDIQSEGDADLDERQQESVESGHQILLVPAAVVLRVPLPILAHGALELFLGVSPQRLALRHHGSSDRPLRLLN
jgi:hypothetical protein